MAETQQVQPTPEPRGKQATPTPKPQRQERDLRQEITDRMVAALEQGQIPWDRPWQELEHGLPRNMVSDRAYHGGNRMILLLTQMERGYADPRYGTVKQVNDLGGRVAKGEKGIPIELWKDQPFWERRDVEISLNRMRVKVFDEAQGRVQIGVPTDKASTRTVKPGDLTVRHKGQELSWGAAHQQLDTVVGRVYTVFNAEQCTGLEIAPLKVPENKVQAVDRAEQLMQAMRDDGLRFATHPQHAFYSPRRDEVSLPPRERFKSAEGYYGTALHEIGHATGAQPRLNREGITGGHRFGSEAYAKEELRAELFSTFMAAETGIPHDEEQHKAYIQSWAKVLQHDKHEIFRAAAEAGKAVDYVLGKERALQLAQTRDVQAAMDKAQAQPAHAMTFAAFSAAATVEALHNHGRQWEVLLGEQSLGFADGPTPKGALRQVHRREVNNALYGSQPDAPDFLRTSMPPAEVLAEYPDLQQQWAAVIALHQPMDHVDQVQKHQIEKPATQDPASMASEPNPSSQPARSMFWRKVGNVEDVCDGVINLPGAGPQGVQAVKVIDAQALSAAAYDQFTADFFACQPWLAGKGGVEEVEGGAPLTHVVEVTAPQRQTLHIDPSGHDDACYVGIPEADVPRVMASRSFVVLGPAQEMTGPETHPAPHLPLLDLSPLPTRDAELERSR
ncbi:hypothetical protein THIX_30405 [Thiomonas sp. X19]|uniref:ArdC family protein n=1 Tax=Thiomonas sp. X19 TaxID=1050370 RepID=UPI000B6AAC40|nr:zincin-like metallopeptidase domain-containing protein [Thiomonas sp. X19]SCC93177.1 hypothetical protein THIX_30405 [Thiomonas sp. X19]